jgi:hypothetical protein
MSSALSDGAVSGLGSVVPQAFAVGQHRSYLEFWAVTGGLYYL